MFKIVGSVITTKLDYNLEHMTANENQWLLFTHRMHIFSNEPIVSSHYKNLCTLLLNVRSFQHIFCTYLPVPPSNFENVDVFYCRCYFIYHYLLDSFVVLLIMIIMSDDLVVPVLVQGILGHGQSMLGHGQDIQQPSSLYGTLVAELHPSL